MQSEWAGIKISCVLSSDLLSDSKVSPTNLHAGWFDEWKNKNKFQSCKNGKSASDLKSNLFLGLFAIFYPGARLHYFPRYLHNLDGVRVTYVLILNISAENIQTPKCTTHTANIERFHEVAISLEKHDSTSE